MPTKKVIKADDKFRRVFNITCVYNYFINKKLQSDIHRQLLLKQFIPKLLGQMFETNLVFKISIDVRIAEFLMNRPSLYLDLDFI